MHKVLAKMIQDYVYILAYSIRVMERLITIKIITAETKQKQKEHHNNSYK